jgi:hypothetical protein
VGLVERKLQMTANGSRIRIIEPAEPLLADTTYELEQDSNTGSAIFTTFTTGAEVDDEPPAPPKIHSLELDTVNIDGSIYGAGICFDSQILLASAGRATGGLQRL